MIKRMTICLVVVLVFGFVGCSSFGQALDAKDCLREYDHIRNLEGEDNIFNFTNLTNFELKNTVEISSDKIIEVAKQPFRETALWQFSTPDKKEKAYLERKWLSFFLPSNIENTLEMYTDFAVAYHDGKLENKDTIEGGYETPYTDYVQSYASIMYSEPKLPNSNMINTIEGALYKGMYTMTALIKPTEIKNFLIWFAKCRPYTNYLQMSTGDNPVINEADPFYFIDLTERADFEPTIKMTIEFNGAQLRSKRIQIDVMGKGDFGKTTILSTSEYSIGNVNVKNFVRKSA